jgi:predicted Zn-dependent peptidase
MSDIGDFLKDSEFSDFAGAARKILKKFHPAQAKEIKEVLEDKYIFSDNEGKLQSLRGSFLQTLGYLSGEDVVKKINAVKPDDAGAFVKMLLNIATSNQDEVLKIVDFFVKCKISKPKKTPDTKQGSIKRTLEKPGS